MQVETVSLDITNICRTCLAMKGEFLSIYDTKGPSEAVCVVADMLRNLTNISPMRNDGMPEKVCLECLSEINRCYSFKMKCDNSNKKLRLLLNIKEELVELEEEVQSKIERNTLDSLLDEEEKLQKEVEQEQSGEIYSVQAKEELEASYFLIGLDEKNVGGEEKQDEGNSGDSDETLDVNDSEEYKITTRGSALRKKAKINFIHPSSRIKYISEHHNKHKPGHDQEKQELNQQEGQHKVFESIGKSEEINVSGEPLLVEEKVEVKKNKYRCPRCEAGFVQQKSLNIHIQQKKCTKKQHSCVKCQKVFISLKNLNAHVRTHKKPFICGYCDQAFGRIEQLNDHKAKEHGLKTRNKCPICKKVFTMLSTLKDHMRIHSGERPFLCSFCGKSFSQNSNLRQHLMRHNENKPFKCEQCPRSFVSKGELHTHVRSHNGDHPFVCNVCNSAFTTSSSMVKHKRIHTGERPYACEFCPIRFNELSTLKNHRRTHTGEKPYQCKFCERAYAQKSDCTIHMRAHTGERRYVCQICGSAYLQSSTLLAHLKTHERVKGKTEERERDDDKVDDKQVGSTSGTGQ